MKVNVCGAWREGGREGRGGEAGDREVKSRGGGGRLGRERADEKSWLKKKKTADH